MVYLVAEGKSRRMYLLEENKEEKKGAKGLFWKMLVGEKKIVGFALLVGVYRVSYGRS